jgi:protein phosphatase
MVPGPIEEATMPAQILTDDLRWHTASDRGARSLNADATAVRGSAFVVADGVGDTPAAAEAAAIAARVAAEVADREGPVAGILAAQQAVQDGDAVLVVAVLDDFTCDVAWVGDCRAYYSNGRVLQQITVDHTLAEYLRSRNAEAPPRTEHVVTTSVRTVRPERIGTTRTSVANGRLLLCSDGVHKILSPTALHRILDQPEAAASSLVDAAITLGGRDNATALVVEHTVDVTEERLAA